MHYKKDKSLALKSSASSLCNNLSVHVNLSKGIISYAVVHKSVVNLISASTDGSSANHRQVVCKEPSASHGNTMVLQAKLVPMASRLVLVVASQKGIQIFEADGSLMLYWYALGDVAQSEANFCFGRGICGVDANTLCIGTHEGLILVFDVPNKGTNITLSESLRGHNAAICDIVAERNCMASSDDLGNIILWQPGETFNQRYKISGTGYPCSSLSLWDDLLIAGYGTGHLRVFNIVSGKICVEACAHAKWITAVDVAKSSGHVLSASEDGYVRVWQLIKGASIKMELCHSENVTDSQLQGARFVSEDGRAFGCTGYDSNEIFFFTQA